MRKSPKNAFAEWEALLQAVRETEGDLGCVTPFREALANAQAQALTFKTLRDSLEASVGDASHRLRNAMITGEDAAVSLRCFLRSMLGVRNEKLLRYGILPLGGRRRRARDKVHEVSIT